MSSESPLTFPCSYPLKVMGPDTPQFSNAVMAVFYRHFEPHQLTVDTRPSSGGTYVSMTVTFTATSRDQLETLYRELRGSKLVLMTL